MRLLFYVFATPETGLGHLTRCLALADEAWRHNHQVAGGTRAGSYLSYDEAAFDQAIGAFSPDWIIVDLPGEPSPYVAQTKAKLCLIDGVGHENGLKPDLVISQGFKGEYHAPEYLILRRSLDRYKSRKRGNSWLVYGGAADELGLLPAFSRAMYDKPANLLVTDLMRDKIFDLSQRHSLVSGKDEAVLGWYGQAGQAAVHMGMIAWELLYLGVPTYIFSRSERHLKTALEFDKRGWAKAWPTLGLPGERELREFLLTPFEPPIGIVDLAGAGRVLGLMERD